MNIEQRMRTRSNGWSSPEGAKSGEKYHLVFLFAETGALKEKGLHEEVKDMYPGAHIFGCSTSGEIFGTRVFDGTVSATAVRFERTEVRGARLSLSGTASSYEAGRMLAQSIGKEGLRHVFVLSAASPSMESDLVRGLRAS